MLDPLSSRNSGSSSPLAPTEWLLLAWSFLSCWLRFLKPRSWVSLSRIKSAISNSFDCLSVLSFTSLYESFQIATKKWRNIKAISILKENPNRGPSTRFALFNSAKSIFPPRHMRNSEYSMRWNVEYRWMSLPNASKPNWAYDRKIMLKIIE